MSTLRERYVRSGRPFVARGFERAFIRSGMASGPTSDCGAVHLDSVHDVQRSACVVEASNEAANALRTLVCDENHTLEVRGSIPRLTRKTKTPRRDTRCFCFGASAVLARMRLDPRACSRRRHLRIA